MEKTDKLDDRPITAQEAWKLLMLHIDSKWLKTTEGQMASMIVRDSCEEIDNAFVSAQQVLDLMQEKTNKKELNHDSHKEYDA